MVRNITILGTAAAVIALPFIFRHHPETGNWKQGDPVLVIISPHNEAIRYEFARAFSQWHKTRYGTPVKVDWRNIGGTTEIMRYLASEYVAAFRGSQLRRGLRWPDRGAEMILDRNFNPESRPDPPAEDEDTLARWDLKRDMHQRFRNTDDPAEFTCRIDLFFGGGSYDHGKAFLQGLTVAPWDPGSPPPDTLVSPAGTILVPERMSGETWRTPTFFGNALSTFGICYNKDRLEDLGIPLPPSRWEDLAHPAYYRQLGMADPTKSGSIAKAFEMIIHEQCDLAVRDAGYPADRVTDFEARFQAARMPVGETPDGVPLQYQDAVESGWLNGLRLIQRMGANARYFTDSSSKVPLDVSMGNAAAGLAIDFYGRYQAETSRVRGGNPRMVYVTPTGGSSVSADPISLLRGAEHRETAVRFIAFVLGEDGQKLWNYRPGTPGGPHKFSLRRLPARREFYPSDDPAVHASFLRHRPHTADVLGDPRVDPYALAKHFTYRPRWTARHFNIHRDLIRAMCLDAGDELREAWSAILENGGPERQPDAMAALHRMPHRPEPLTWRSAQDIGARHSRLDIMREWTLFFRKSYREAAQLARGTPPVTDGEEP
ncbi:MAG: extracellular solute-binding protein [Lentisphaerae bacterium]|nr:extracellular solute-binding protein [Lentisphaerota bacterium]